MKIAVSASGPELDAGVDPRFGRAPYFLLVRPDTMDFEVVNNQRNLQIGHGAGIQTASMVVKCEPAAVITGKCGPKAFRVLQTAGIPVFIGISGTVRGAVQQYHQGKLAQAQAPNTPGHW
jgi:predicted Fe-Mo cluster-binding NifX family protein